jgi:hypothetical protein
MDMITLTLVIFNVSLTAIISIFFSPISQEDESLPSIYRQISNLSVLLAAVCISWPFLCLSEWSVWMSLLTLVLWDVVAVLTPCGPLRYLMETEQVSGISLFLPVLTFIIISVGA